jgi:FKBP-type peptidyl-prolyl cis-trans isomerase FklB
LCTNALPHTQHPRRSNTHAHHAHLLVACLSIASASDAAGSAFLTENKGKDGVVTLPSGLQYKVLRASTVADGKTPKSDSPCKCHYEGKLIDGTVFDSSFKRGQPSTFAPNQVIKGWTEVMQLMKEVRRGVNECAGGGL